jgi:hypothetical protein
VAEQGRGKAKIKNKFKSSFKNKNEIHMWALRAHTAFAVDLLTPVHRLYFSQTSGAVRRGLFEHVAAQQIVRVPQPRLFVKNRGNPAGAVNRGSPSFGYFSLAKQEK